MVRREVMSAPQVGTCNGKGSARRRLQIPVSTRGHGMIAETFAFGRSLTRASLLCLFMLLSLMPSTSTAAQSARELKEVKVAYPPSMASVTLMTGIKQRFFDEQGLRPVLLVIASDLALKSQVVGEIDYTLFGGGSGMLAAAQGLPIKNVHLPHKFADMTLVARPEFKSVAQLRGKKIGVSSFSGSVYSSTRAMLSAGGLDPDKDVIIIPMGREPIRLQALFAGSIDATPLPVPCTPSRKKKATAYSPTSKGNSKCRSAASP